MKKIQVKYTIEVPEDRFGKTCYKAMVSKKTMKDKLRDMAEVHGRTEVYKWVDEVINKRG